MTLPPASVVLLLLLLLAISSTTARSPPRRTSLLLPVSKHAATNQYTIRLHQGTPSTVKNLVVDLGARYSWIDCETNRTTSSTFSYIPCNSSDCVAALSNACGSPDNICGTFPHNPYIRTSTPGELAQDNVIIQTTDGSNPRRPVAVGNVTFSCGPASLLEGLAAGSVGMAGFGRTGVALPTQFASSLGYLNTFALCLPSYSGSDGVVFFGGDSYRFLQGREFSRASFVYTPLVVNPVSTAGVSFSGEPSVEYFIKVKGVRVNGKQVPIRSSLLSINKKGNGGTKLSTATPYAVLQSSIYRAVVDAFVKESGLKRVKAVAPFGACFDARKVGSTRVGPAVPPIELVLDAGAGSKAAAWTWFGANTMVGAGKGVLCLGLVDGGADVVTSIVVGGHQMADNLLLFDLVGKKLGVTGSLLASQTTCSNFNFTFVP